MQLVEDHVDEQLRVMGPATEVHDRTWVDANKLDQDTQVHVVVPSRQLLAQDSHARQEIIDGGVFVEGGQSALKIQVTSASGAFSDIVLLHQSEV